MSILFSSFGDQLTVVVVGVSGGIGQALLKELLASEQVQTVYGLSRSGNEGNVWGDKYHDILMDYNDEKSIERAANDLPSNIDVVIVATGLLHHQDIIQPEKTYKHLNAQSMIENMQINVIGPALFAKYTVPKMRKKVKTVFAILSARVGSIGDNRLGGWYSYRASKAALNMMIKTYSIELTRRQPQLLMVGLHPGTVNTELSQPFQKNVPEKKLFTPEYSAQCLLSVVDNLEVGDSGECFAWDGQRIAE